MSRARITRSAEDQWRRGADGRAVTRCSHSYLVRDRIERTLSHYRFAVRMKYERRPIAEAVRDPFYCAVSDYAIATGAVPGSISAEIEYGSE